MRGLGRAALLAAAALPLAGAILEARSGGKEAASLDLSLRLQGVAALDKNTRMRTRDMMVMRRLAEGPDDLITGREPLTREDMRSVMFLVKTYHGNYEKQVRAILDTWGRFVPEGSLLFAGDEASVDPPVYGVRECKSDPGAGLACRVGYGLMEAYRRMKEHKWVYVVDDDHYVQVKNVWRAMKKFNASEHIGLGCYGCGVGEPYSYCHNRGGFCGGCTYAFSRQTIQDMIEHPDTGSPEKWEKMHQKMWYNGMLTSFREDMAMSCMVTTLLPDTKTKYPGGLYGGDIIWDVVAKHGCRNVELAQHYVKEVEDFHRIHRLWNANCSQKENEALGIFMNPDGSPRDPLLARGHRLLKSLRSFF